MEKVPTVLNLALKALEIVSNPKQKCYIHNPKDLKLTKNLGGFNKEIQLNLCNIFSIFVFNKLYLFP